MSRRGASKITVSETATPAELAVLEQGLLDHAAAEGVAERGERALFVFARDGSGEPVAGLRGRTFWGWLHVKHLWVAEELRGRGLGATLVRKAEEEARRRGCTGAYLDTFSFQPARGFYERLGYEVFGTLEGFPPGHARFFLRKEL